MSARRGGRRGRPSQANIILIILQGRGGRASLNDLKKELKELRYLSMKTFMKYIKSPENYTEPFIDDVKLLAISVSKSFGKTYVCLPYAFIPTEMMGYFSLLILFFASLLIYQDITWLYIHFPSIIFVHLVMLFRAVWGLIVERRHHLHEPLRVSVRYRNPIPIFRKEYQSSDTVGKVKRHVLKALWKELVKKYGLRQGWTKWYRIKKDLELIPAEGSPKNLNEYYRTYYTRWEKTRLYQIYLLQGIHNNRTIVFDLVNKTS